MAIIKPPSEWRGLRPWSERGIIPVVLGLLWVAIGSSYMLDPFSHKANVALQLPLAIMPQQGWGVFFVFCGILAITSSRWPPHQDTWGFVVLGASAAWWSCSFLFGAIANDGHALSGAISWAIVCVLIWAINRVVPVKRGE